MISMHAMNGGMCATAALQAKLERPGVIKVSGTESSQAVDLGSHGLTIPASTEKLRVIIKILGIDCINRDDIYSHQAKYLKIQLTIRNIPLVDDIKFMPTR